MVKGVAPSKTLGWHSLLSMFHSVQNMLQEAMRSRSRAAAGSQVRLHNILEAGVGIEPASTALQAAA